MVIEIPCLLAPVYALTIIGNRAHSLLEYTIYFNHKLKGGSFSSLIARYDRIFPNVYLFGVTVTKTKFLAALLTVSVPLLSRFGEYLMQMLL